MKHILLFTIIVSLLFTQCKKGDPGPAGATGATGAVGPTGPTGGIGTANVIYSDWFPLLPAVWSDTVMLNINRAKRAIQNASAITQQILDSGVVLGYLKSDDNGGGPYTLPYTYGFSPARQYAIIPRVGKIIFYNYAYDGSGGESALTTHRFRYIIIPGGIRTGGRVRDMSTWSYDEICTTFNIPK